MSHHDWIVYGDQNLKVPAHLNFGKFMLQHLRRLKHEIALENADTHEKLTYEGLTRFAVNMACALKKIEVGLGDTIALGSEKRNEFIPTALGIIFTGATYTPYDTVIGTAILKHQLSIAEPKYFICTDLFWNKHKDLLKTFDCIKHFITLDVERDNLISAKNIMSNMDVDNYEPTRVQGQSDVAIILYSSGMTGLPKGVQLTHLNCIVTSLQVDVALLYPAMIALLSKAEDLSQYNLDSLKIMYSRSSPLHKRTIENVKMRYPNLQNILQRYGMTECGEPTSENWGSKGPKPGSVGMASPGLIIKIVDPQTNEILGPNEHGEIRVTGQHFMKGYIGIDPTRYLDDQGFLKTGDLGYYDEDKYFYIVDRIKDIISYRRWKVSPLELESILLAHPKVLQAAVVGKEDPTDGEQPTAFVVKQQEADVTVQELVDYVASEVSPQMQLRGGVRFVEEIPRNLRGKILRRQLKETLNIKNNVKN